MNLPRKKQVKTKATTTDKSKAEGSKGGRKQIPESTRSVGTGRGGAEVIIRKIRGGPDVIIRKPPRP